MSVEPFDLPDWESMLDGPVDDETLLACSLLLSEIVETGSPGVASLTAHCPDSPGLEAIITVFADPHTERVYAVSHGLMHDVLLVLNLEGRMIQR